MKIKYQTLDEIPDDNTLPKNYQDVGDHISILRKVKDRSELPLRKSIEGIYATLESRTVANTDL